MVMRQISLTSLIVVVVACLALWVVVDCLVKCSEEVVDVDLVKVFLGCTTNNLNELILITIIKVKQQFNH
jgi:hypothetical protein